MNTLPATLQNAYLARGFRPVTRFTGNAAEVLASLIVQAGGSIDMVVIAETAADLDQPTLFPDVTPAPFCFWTPETDHKKND